MRKILTLLLLLPLLAAAQTGTWRAYMAYHEPQQIVKVGNKLYVRASDNLYSYSLTDQSITTYDKVNQLSDTHITHIAWSKTAKRLIVVYQNSNIDLIDEQDEVTNISALYMKSMTQDKTVNNLFIDDVYAYLATNFGVVKVNMRRAEISESCILNQVVTAIDRKGGSLYLKTGSGEVKTIAADKSIINPNNWTTASSLPDALFEEDLTDQNQYADLVATLQPGGPKYNYFNYMRFENNRLLTTGGGWKDGGEFNRPACAQIMDTSGNWTCITDMQPLTGTRLNDATAIATDPADSDHYFISTCGTGLYEFQGTTMVRNYTTVNSPLQSALDSLRYSQAYMNYVRVDGLVFDSNRRLWMSCSAESANKNSLLRLDISTGEWTTFNNAQLTYGNTIFYILTHAISDASGHIWIANDHHNHPCLLRIDPLAESFTRYDNLTNQDGTSYDLHYFHAVAQDRDGNIWAGTDLGLFMYDAAQQADPTQGFTQIKVPRNDGSDYADYLMANVSISAIAIDGANRKWVGTDGNGVYLISADNMEQLYHFTTDNSPLISNSIESIAINDATGEVFFGTDQGLCSYMADATTAVSEMNKDDVYAFPNPVPSGYSGLITVRGLSMDADVKILTVSGRLVAQGRSNGGTFTWDGRDLSGRRVASGVYMVAAANSTGEKGTVCKIAIIR